MLFMQFYIGTIYLRLQLAPHYFYSNKVCLVKAVLSLSAILQNLQMNGTFMWKKVYVHLEG